MTTSLWIWHCDNKTHQSIKIQFLKQCFFNKVTLHFGLCPPFCQTLSSFWPTLSSLKRLLFKWPVKGYLILGNSNPLDTGISICRKHWLGGLSAGYPPNIDKFIQIYFSYAARITRSQKVQSHSQQSKIRHIFQQKIPYRLLFWLQPGATTNCL